MPLPADDQVRLIPVTGGMFALVDAADYEWLSRYGWRSSGGTEGYARTTIAGKNVFMHRLIMNPPPGRVVDHVNANRWDNRRDNLRVCTQAENLRNRRSFRGNSRFKGVHWNERVGKWVASICLNRKLIHLGYFDDEVEAAHAYDRKARELFGPFAYLNFPEATRIVLLSGRIEVHSHICARITVGKSEIRMSKSETNPNHRDLKFKTKVRRATAFRTFEHLNFGDCFALRDSHFAFPRSPPWPTGPPSLVVTNGSMLFDKFIWLVCSRLGHGRWVATRAKVTAMNASAPSVGALSNSASNVSRPRRGHERERKGRCNRTSASMDRTTAMARRGMEMHMIPPVRLSTWGYR